MTDEVSDIRLFAAIVAAGNLSAAARQLETSPAAMSRRLGALESRLGIRLVTRTTRRFELTEEGALFHERCLSIIDDIEDAEAEVVQGLDSPGGHLRVTAPLHWGRNVLSEVVAAFSERYPNIEIQLVLADAIFDPVRDGVDVVLGVLPPTGADMVVTRALRSRRLVIASPDYIARHGEPKVPDDLLAHDCIRLFIDGKPFDHWSFRENGRIRTIHVKGRLTTTSTEVMQDWVLAGRGVGLKAEWDIERDIAEGRLVACLPDYWCDEISLYICYANRRHLPPRIRVFLDFLRATIARASGAKNGDA
ncbi:LysR family transcriptional regulator [Chenggangzhangella methanolivorans]|uniref:LysR family transcriptional regulator n=1 Tax=Chenggangzhangella methanolivorans TaxID=1437009 RepID=UPI0036164BCF